MKQKYRDNILIVDDDPYILESVSGMLNENDYSTVTCDNIRDAMARLKENSIDVVLTDIRMPGGSGIDLLEEAHAVSPEVPVILMTAYSDLALAIDAISKGAFDFLPKPYQPEHLLHTIEKAVKHNKLIRMEKNYKHDLEAQVREKTQKLTSLSREVIKLLTTVAEFRDTDTGNHISRIGFYSNKIAECMNMPMNFIETITYASTLHDIGKIGVSDNILLKEGPLTSEEFEFMKAHTIIGERMLSGSSHPVLKNAALIALTHHERWDGTGYPNKLKGRDIPIEGRILIICDQYDALMSKRPYKPSLSHEVVVDILTKGDGRTMPEHFDPEVLSAFKEIALVFEEIFDAHGD